MNQNNDTKYGVWLAGFSKLVVAFTFLLIFVGGHTTTAGAGMAFPDWPLSHGSLYPNPWWDDFFQRLEHSDRLIASLVGLSVAVLCAWVWGRFWAVGACLLTGAAIGLAAKWVGFPSVMIYGALWGTVVSFLVFLFSRRGAASGVSSRSVRVLAVLAFFGICFLAVLVGLRVTIESGGSPEVALIFRVVQGCFAQVELSQLVAVAAMLSGVYPKIGPVPRLQPIRNWLVLILCVLFTQLALGAAMRHCGAGLAIPSFPAASIGGSWMPSVHTVDVDLNFSHTRLGAALVSVLVVWVLGRLIFGFGRQGGVRLWAGAGLGILLVQICLGVSVIWYVRPMIPTTLHVLNGAGLVVLIVLLMVRVSRSGGLAAESDRFKEERMVDGFAG